jgi:hypothetical protein
MHLKIGRYWWHKQIILVMTRPSSPQFSPLMTKLQQAIGAHLILCCIACGDEMPGLIIDRVRHMIAVLGYA